MKKTHLNLATSDLEKSVAFFSTLLDAKPTKVLSDYALFVSDDPGLELALDLRVNVDTGGDAHYGVCVETAIDVERAIERLTAKGLLSSIEREETCCYANQTKAWTIDPEGRRWEVYTVHEDTQDRDGDDSICCSSYGEPSSCCAA